WKGDPLDHGGMPLERLPGPGGRLAFAVGENLPELDREVFVALRDEQLALGEEHLVPRDGGQQAARLRVQEELVRGLRHWRRGWVLRDCRRPGSPRPGKRPRS